jgi:hypothetical protein
MMARVPKLDQNLYTQEKKNIIICGGASWPSSPQRRRYAVASCIPISTDQRNLGGVMEML